jgi:hypothetical protein
MRTSVSTTSGPNESISASACSPLVGFDLVAVAFEQGLENKPDVLFVVGN